MLSLLVHSVNKKIIKQTVSEVMGLSIDYKGFHWDKNLEKLVGNLLVGISLQAVHLCVCLVPK